MKPNWQQVRFGDVVRLNTERVADPVAEGVERYLGLEHLTPEDLRIRSWGLVAEGTTFTNYFRPGQVLFGKRRAYQRKVAVADFSGVCSGDIYVFESKDQQVLLPELLPFICQTEGFFNHAVGTSAGSLSPRTNWTQLANYEFALPPLEEQRRMVTVLQHANQVYEEHCNLAENTQRMFKSAAMTKFSMLLKNNTKMQSLSDVCLFGPQSGLYKKKDFYGAGFPMVHMGELFRADCITSDTEMQLVDLSPKEITKYSLTSNDLLFGRRSVVLEGAGRCILVKDIHDTVTFESSILRVTLDENLVSNEYVYEWFNSPEGIRRIRGITTFTTVAGVKGSDVARLQVPIPELSVQYLVSEELNALREGLAIIERRSEKTQELFTELRETVLAEVR